MEKEMSLSEILSVIMKFVITEIEMETKVKVSDIKNIWYNDSNSNMFIEDRATGKKWLLYLDKYPA